MNKAIKAEKVKTAATETEAMEAETAMSGATEVSEPEAGETMAEETAEAEKESADETKSTGEAENTGESQAQQVYCGPSIKDVVREGTVFAGGIPEALEEYIQNNPAVRSLIVPLTDFAAFRADIGRKGTPANIIYSNVLSVIKRRK